jgi:hypothetical protein
MRWSGRSSPMKVLLEEEVIQILDLLRQRVPQRIIAGRFGVSKKTISRINTGDTWKEVCFRYNRETPSEQIQLPFLNVTPITPEVADVLDELVAVKNHFGLDFKQPIHWGWFESWDGIHSVVSDGYIIWESRDLVKFAKRLVGTNIHEAPVYAYKAEELPTFELEDLMTMIVGEKYSIDAISGDVVRLVYNECAIYLKRKYVTIANSLRLDIRAAGQSGNYAYMTKNKPRSPNDPMPIVIACAVTIKEATT